MAASCEPDFSSWDPHNKRLVYCDMGTFSTASKFRTVAMFLNPTDLAKLATENITKQRFWSLDHPVDTKCSLRLRTKSCCVSIFFGGAGTFGFFPPLESVRHLAFSQGTITKKQLHLSNSTIFLCFSDHNHAAPILLFVKHLTVQLRRAQKHGKFWWIAKRS